MTGEFTDGALTGLEKIESAVEITSEQFLQLVQSKIMLARESYYGKVGKKVHPYVSFQFLSNVSFPDLAINATDPVDLKSRLIKEFLESEGYEISDFRSSEHDISGVGRVLSLDLAMDVSDGITDYAGAEISEAADIVSVLEQAVEALGPDRMLRSLEFAYDEAVEGDMNYLPMDTEEARNQIKEIFAADTGQQAIKFKIKSPLALDLALQKLEIPIKNAIHFATGPVIKVKFR